MTMILYLANKGPLAKKVFSHCEPRFSQAASCNCWDFTTHSSRVAASETKFCFLKQFAMCSSQVSFVEAFSL